MPKIQGIALALSSVYDTRLRQKAIEKSQNIINEQNKLKFEGLEDVSGEAFAREVKIGLTNDLEAIEKANVLIAGYPNKGNIHFSIRFNKMEGALSEVKKIFGEDESVVVKLAEGKFPSNYDNIVTTLPDADNKDSFYGTSKPTFLSTALLSVNFTLNNTTINDIDIIKSGITHVALLPEDFKLPENYRFKYTKNSDHDGFGFVHSGYAFGGYRNQEKLYPNGKALAPEDCASWLTKLLSCSHIVSTADQYIASKMNTSQGFEASKNWETQPMAQYLINNFENISPENIHAGDIYLHRRFKEDTHSNGDFGIGGHTSIILGSTEPGKVLTMSANREMPSCEGMALQSFNLNLNDNFDPKKEVCIVRLKEGAVTEFLHHAEIKQFEDKQYHTENLVDMLTSDYLMQKFDSIIAGEISDVQ